MVLQGVTKYVKIGWRSNLDPDHKKFMLLHQMPGENSIEISDSSVMVLKEPHRQGWKKRIRYKDSGQPRSHRNKDRSQKEVKTTTTFFASTLQDSLLYKLVKDC